MSVQGRDRGGGNVPGDILRENITTEPSQAIVDLSGSSHSNVDMRGMTINILPGSRQTDPPRVVQEQACNENLFIQTYNEFTATRTRDRVTSTFERLKSPHRQVNPEFIITEFYEGATGLQSGEYVLEAPSMVRKKRHFVGEVIKLEDILNNVNNVALIANAGAGKTVSAKRFAQMALGGNIPHLHDIKLVHFVPMAELDWTAPHTAYDLVFVQPLGNRISDSVRQFGFQWLKNNGGKVLLIFDGLDQASWTLEEMHTISSEQPDVAPVIMHNILNKDLFRGCKIVITSREHSVRHLSAPVRPHRTVALAGLLPKDREFLIKEMGGADGEKIWKHMQLKSPGLFSLCENPAFSVFTSAVMVDNLENSPETMTGILMEVLNYFANSEQQREHDFEYVFERLKKMAFKGTSERRVLFKMTEIEGLDLTASQVQDFVVVAPKKTNTCHFKIMERSMTLFFCHQTIQEALTALCVSELPFNEFEDFVQYHFNDPHFEVVRRIIAGVILDSKIDTSDISEIQNKDMKATVLRKFVKNLIETYQRGRSDASSNGREDLPLYSLLHECGDGIDDVIREDIHHVRSQEKLRAENLFVMSSITRRCNLIETAVFSTICPSDWDIETLVQGLKKCRSVKIMVVKLIEMKEGKSFRSLGEILSIASVENLIFTDCVLSTNNASEMTSSAAQNPKQVATLDLSGNREIEDGAFPYLGRLIRCSRTSDLQFNSCNLTGEKLLNLKNSLDGYDSKIYRLGLSSNENMTPECLKCVGQVVRNGKVEHLNVSRCKLRKEQLHKLGESLQGYSWQMERFDISGNESLEPPAYEDIGRIVVCGKVKNLNISTCKLGKEKLRALKMSSDDYPGQMKSLDVAWNGESLDYDSLGNLVEHWKVNELICHGCFLRKQNVRDFMSSLKEMRRRVKITHGSVDVQSTTTSVDEFLRKIDD